MAVITLANIASAALIAADLTRVVSGAAGQFSELFGDGRKSELGDVLDDIAALTQVSADAAGSLSHLNALLKKVHADGRDVTDQELAYFREAREQVRARWAGVAKKARLRIAAQDEGGGAPEPGLPGSGSAGAESGQAPAPEPPPPAA